MQLRRSPGSMNISVFDYTKDHLYDDEVTSVRCFPCTKDPYFDDKFIRCSPIPEGAVVPNFFHVIMPVQF